MRRLIPLLLSGALLSATFPARAGCSVPGFDPVWRLPLPDGVGTDPSVLVDLDGDGRPDLVLSTRDGLAILREKERDFGPPATIHLGGYPVALAAGDVDGDGAIDLAVAIHGRPEALLLLRGDGTGGFRAPLHILDATDPGSVFRLETGDLDENGRPEIVALVTLAEPTRATRLVAVDGRTLEVRTLLPSPVSGFHLADVDGDGHLDLLTDQAVLRNDGRGGFGPPEPLQLGDGPLEVGDVDGDGTPDIVAWGVAYAGLGPEGPVGRHGVGVRRGSPEGFGTPWLDSTVGTFPFRDSPKPGLALADLDDDGRLDVITSALDLAILSLRDGYLPATVTTLDAPAGTGLVAVRDLDGDGRPDLLVASDTELTILRNTCGPEGTSRALVVPFVLSAPGAGGRAYRTELVVRNSGPRNAPITWRYTAAFGGGSGTMADAVAAGRQLVIPDIVDRLRSLGLPIDPAGSRGGTLRAEVTGLDAPEDVAVLARVVTPHGEGLAGVAFPAAALADLLEAPSVVPLVAAAEDRTNLAVLNAGGPADGEIELGITVTSIEPGGTPVALDPIRLAPGQWRQLDRVLATELPGISAGLAVVSRVAGTAPFLAYAVVHDETTNDGSFLAARSGGGLLMTIPVVAVGEQPYTSTLLGPWWPPPGIGAYTKLYGNTGVEEGLRIGGPPNVGPAVVTPFTAGSTASVSAAVFSRTTIAADGGGRYGVAAPAVSLRRLATRSARIDGLRRDGSTRSNLAIAIPADETGTFRIDLHDGDTGTLAASVERTVVRWAQWNVATLLPVGATATNLYARVVRLTGPSGFIAYGVLVDGAAPGLGTGDGSYLAMRADTEP